MISYVQVGETLQNLWLLPYGDEPASSTTQTSIIMFHMPNIAQCTEFVRIHHVR